MKILVVGDSYATDYSELSWPGIITSHFQCAVDNCARPASSLYFSFLKLTERLKNNTYDVVIFALTCADRPYHRDMLIHGGFPQYNDGTPVSDKIKQVIGDYYLHLYDEQNTAIINSAVCRAIAQMSLEYPTTKFIFLPAFQEFENLTVGNCVITSDRLIHYSMLDKEGHEAEVQGKQVEKNNHLTELQNKTLAKYVIDCINTYKFGCVTYIKLDQLEEL